MDQTSRAPNHKAFGVGAPRFRGRLGGKVRRMNRNLSSAIALALVAPALAGCIGEPGGGDWVAHAPSLATTSSTRGWQVGNWWAYEARFDNNVTIDVALVVAVAFEDGFVLGSNLSAGFFGLPFLGNVTRPDLNPVIAGDEWPLYRFPLEHAKSWSYRLLGYDLVAHVVAETVEAPRVGSHEGFVIEAASFGQVVARYTYSPATEWFTRLVIFEPTDGHEVVRVELKDYGESYAADYFVTVPIGSFEATYPGVPDTGEFGVGGAYLRVTASYVLAGRLGDFRVTLKDPHDRVVLHGNVRPHGVIMDRREVDPAPGRWTVEHLGIGEGSLHVEVAGVKPARSGRVVPMDATRAPEVPAIHLGWGPPAVVPTARAPAAASLALLAVEE